jgi:hypothetical protein
VPTARVFSSVSVTFSRGREISTAFQAFITPG